MWSDDRVLPSIRFSGTRVLPEGTAGPQADARSSILSVLCTDRVPEDEAQAWSCQDTSDILDIERHGTTLN